MRHMKEVAAVMTATENTAFQTGISGSLSVSQSRKYRRNRITKGFIRHSHIDRVRIQDRVLIEWTTKKSKRQTIRSGRWFDVYDESKNLEFKVQRPKDGSKYMKRSVIL